MQANRLILSRRAVLFATAALAAGATRVAAQTPVASPVAAGAFADRIGDLMARVPAELVEITPDSLNPFTYADLTTQLASLGIPRPSGDDLPDGFLAGTESLPLADNAFQFALTTEWPETFGFEPLALDRVLIAGEPPNTVSVYAGVDTERVRAALMASGYTEMLQEIGGEYYTFGDSLDPSTPVGRLGVGRMNQAVVRDGVAIFSREEAMIQQVTHVMAGAAPSMLEAGGWPSLMTCFSGDTVGVVALAPAAFARAGDPGAMQQAAFGVRAGATSADIQAADKRGEDLPEPETIADVPETRARVEVRIRYADAATAAAEARAIPDRWETMDSAVTGQPLTGLMLVESAAVSEVDPTVAAIDFRVKGAGGWWHQMIYRNDLGAFVPQG